ncbi:DUF2961 domain-containing protein [bacterium]|nr:DUF2961 domain-containing protein [bacterium]
MFKFSRILAVAVVFSMVAFAGAAPITFQSLVAEMTDLSRLAEFPDPPYTCSQASSYDRRSTDPSVLTDENWFANGDAGQFIRTEKHGDRTEYVMMDAEGPGAIVRFWSANANDGGVVRFYFDGSDTPAIEMPMQDMLNGKNWPYLAPIAGVRSRGWNNHLPIPYAKHCKVTADKNRFYYQINYRTYGKDVAVETFKPGEVETHRQLIERVAATLKRPEEFRPAGVLAGEEELHLVLAAGMSGEHTTTGGGAIARLAVNVYADDIEVALRKTLLTVTFDDQKEPSIVAPLGDFFGAAPGLNPYFGLPLGVEWEGRMYCNWVMPFKDKAVFRLVNHSEKPVVVVGRVSRQARPWTDRSMYFHAKWRMEHPIPTRPRQDWTYLAATGQGRFVGDSLNVTNPVAAWWGEGDEKIYVDGEKFPSTFGTGTEDYYGYAWCCPDPFTHAYHNQPRCDGPANYGQTSVNRFHIIDDIPFTKSFKFDMEVWHWAETQVGMAVVSYWYAGPDARDDFPAVTAADLRVPGLPGHKRVKDALEGEELTVLDKTGGVTERQPLDPLEWSRGAHLWWRNGAPGDVLTLALPVEEAGKYEVIAVFTKAQDYGIMQISINGQAAGAPMDFYGRGVTHTPETSLGVFDLVAGDNKLQAKIMGKNERAVPNYMMGLDYILLKPVK